MDRLSGQFLGWCIVAAFIYGFYRLHKWHRENPPTLEEKEELDRLRGWW